MYPCIMIDKDGDMVLATSATHGVWLDTGEYDEEDHITWDDAGFQDMVDAKQLQDLLRCLQHAYECGQA